MKLNVRRAKLSEKQEIISIIQFLKKHNSIFQNIFYDDPLLNKDGIHLIMYPSILLDAVQVQTTAYLFKEERDVVKTSIIFVPEEWINEATQ